MAEGKCCLHQNGLYMCGLVINTVTNLTGHPGSIPDRSARLGQRSVRVSDTDLYDYHPSSMSDMGCIIRELRGYSNYMCFNCFV